MTVRLLIFISIACTCLCTLPPFLAYDDTWPFIVNSIKDGSFELQTMYWEEQEIPTWNSLICSLECPYAKRDTLGPKEGKYFVWFTGFGTTNAHGHLKQMIKLPRANTNVTLSFWLAVETTGPNDSELTFKLGLKTLSTFNCNDNLYYGNWTLVTLNFKTDDTGCRENCLLSIKYNSPRNEHYYLTHYFVDVVSLNTGIYWI